MGETPSMKAPQVSAGAGRHSLQPQPATCSSPTHRQPWKPPRTRLSCSSLQHKGCEQQGNPSRLQLRPAWVTPGMQQGKTQQAASRTRVLHLPPTADGCGIHIPNATGSVWCAWCMLQGTAEHYVAVL